MRPSEPAHEPATPATDLPVAAPLAAGLPAADPPAADLPAVGLRAAELLARVEPLPYARRMRELALYARRAPGLTALLAELREGDGHARRTALHLAMAAREFRFVEEVLAGPDMELRRAALRAARTLPIPDAAVAAALDDAPVRLRLAVYRALAQSRRRTLAEALLPAVRARWGDREAAALLPACGGAVVAERLPGLAHAVTSWTALGRRHPRAVLDAAGQELAEGIDPSAVRRRRARGFELAARAEPLHALDLLERHDRRGGLAADLSPEVLAGLARADAGRTTRLLTRRLPHRWWSPPKPLLKALRSRPDAEIAATVAAYPQAFDDILRSLPPYRRGPLFDAEAARRGRPGGLWSRWLLPLLPSDRAAAEARRMLAWHASVWHSSRRYLDDPALPLELTSYLPYEEAAGPLREAAFGGDARLRGIARSLLVRCAGRTRDPDALRVLLDELAGRTANEQDPVRVALLAALCEVAPWRLGSCAGPLERVAADAVAAPDRSPATRDALRRLAGRVLRHHDPATAVAGWALGVYAKLAMSDDAEAFSPPVPSSGRVRRRRRGRPGPEPYDLARALRRGQEHALLAVLRPALAAARDRGDHALPVALARALGRRARGLAELQADLHTAILHAPEPQARRAADLWLAQASEREERVSALVRQDPSTVTLPPVWRTVAARHTHLLVPLVNAVTQSRDGADRGRFADAAWLPPIVSGVPGRWTPAQRDRVRVLLAAVADDVRQPLAARASAVAATGRVGGALDLLAAWAAHEETTLAEAAVTALVTGADRALPSLVEHARGPRSRVAVAALGRACRLVPPSRLGPVLEGMLSDPGHKVTARKQAARLLERTRTPGAADALLRAWAEDGLHRDVRVAVAAALQRFPEDPRTLDALTASAARHGGERLLRTLFQAGPLDFAPAVRPRCADLARTLLAAADSPGVRFRGARAFATWARWYRGGFDEIVAAVADPGAATGETALDAFVALLREGVVRAETLDVLARLADVVPGEGRTDSMETPARHRVRVVVDALVVMQDRHARPWRRRLARDAMDVLAARPPLLPQAVRLAVALVEAHDDDDPDGLADDLCALAGLLRERPVLAARTVRLGWPGGPGSRHEVEPVALLPAARRLAAEGDLASHLLAVAIVKAAGDRTDWAEPWRGLLRDLRESPHSEVGQDAWDTPVE